MVNKEKLFREKENLYSGHIKTNQNNLEVLGQEKTKT